MNPINRTVNYDQVAPTYDGRYRRGGYAGIEQALLQFAGEQASLQSLEVGCGTGHWLEVLQAHGQHVTGLDFSAQMLAKAQAALPGVALIHGRAEQLPFTNDSFDRLFCINAFHHFAHKAAFLAEARRLLRPGGKLLSVGLDPHTGLDHWYIYDYFPESFTIDKERFPPTGLLREWMTSAGFEDCTTRELERWSLDLPASEVLAQSRLEKAATSQLTALTDEEYRRGMQRIQEDMQAAEARGETLFLRGDVRLYGTYGVAGEKGIREKG